VFTSGPFTSLEICAGAGGQALGIERAGFSHLALVEIEKLACETLRANRPTWNVIEGDLREFSARNFQGVDLLAGGVPCPPFSIAGHQLGSNDERDLFPEAIRLIKECSPRAIMLENVKGLLERRFSDYRASIQQQLAQLGYIAEWKLLNASDYRVSQLRPRAILIALKPGDFAQFEWPEPSSAPPISVGALLLREMASMGWEKAADWAESASGVAPTLVGGSKKHGGPDLGPTRARLAWEKLGVNGKGLADNPPAYGFEGLPKLTVKMAALIQGFPPTWEFVGKKTNAYRQVGNAFPPPVAEAVARAIGFSFSPIDEKDVESEMHFGYSFASASQLALLEGRR